MVIRARFQKGPNFGKVFYSCSLLFCYFNILEKKSEKKNNKKKIEKSDCSKYCDSLKLLLFVFLPHFNFYFFSLCFLCFLAYICPLFLCFVSFVLSLCFVNHHCESFYLFLFLVLIDLVSLKN